MNSKTAGNRALVVQALLPEGFSMPCAHEACNCDDAPVNGFCSWACEEQAQSTSAHAECECGHPECRPEFEVEEGGEEKPIATFGP